MGVASPEARPIPSPASSQPGPPDTGGFYNKSPPVVNPVGSVLFKKQAGAYPGP